MYPRSVDLKSVLEIGKLIYFMEFCFKKEKKLGENNDSFLFLDFEKISS